ncbi:MAG TPA: amino acid permease, partial [Haliea salexigens]|nr:amino acid permease [Haliea salexigens]
ALGIIFYLIMDIAIHWGVIRYLREDVKANRWVPATAIALDVLVLGGFLWVKINTDPFVIGVAVASMITIAVAETLFLKTSAKSAQSDERTSQAHDH